MVVESSQPTPTASSGAQGGPGAPAAAATTVGAPTPETSVAILEVLSLNECQGPTISHFSPNNHNAYKLYRDCF